MTLGSVYYRGAIRSNACTNRITLQHSEAARHTTTHFVYCRGAYVFNNRSQAPISMRLFRLFTIPEHTSE